MRSALARMAHRRLCANLWALHVPAVGRVVTRLVRWAGGCRKLRPYDIFVFPVIDWDYRFQRPQHLSLEFARSGHRVFYISTKFLPTFGVRDPLSQFVEPDVHLIRLPCGEESPDIYRDIPDELQLAALEFGLRCVKEKFDIGATLSIVDHPFWGPIAARLSNNIVLYDCMDDYSSFPNSGPSVGELECRIANEADVVVCSSTHLQERIRRFGRESILVRNAADPQHFAWRPPSMTIESNTCTVGYYGAITKGTDVELIAYAARSLPEKRFVLIGRNDGVDLSDLESQPNVTLIGEIPYDRLPEYVYGFDVCILPYRICENRLAADPIKVWEYLSAGKPVVAVRFPEIERLKGLVTLADGREEFVRGICSAVATDNLEKREQRRVFAHENTWQHRCDAMQKAIVPFFPKVSVIILTHNQRRFTEATLLGLERFTGYPNLEIVLVDNGSTDGSAEFLTLWAARRPYAKVVLNSTNLGFSAGNNIGVRSSSGDWLVILNNDVYVTEGWISTLLAHFRVNRGLGLLGPVTNRCGNESVVDIGEYADMDTMAILARTYARSRRGLLTKLPVVNFFCAMIPRRVWQEVGELDEAFGIGLFEDDDYAMRVRRAGYEVACAEDVFVHHHHSASIGALTQGAYQRLFRRNRLYFESKWGPWVPPSFRSDVQDRLTQLRGFDTTR